MQAETTALDHAFAAMDRDPDDDGARLRFHALLADSELIVLLSPGTADNAITPEVFDLAEGRFLMTFDTDERLAAFADAPSVYVAIPGRVILDQLAGKGVGIGLNLGVAPSSFLMGADAVDWLADVLRQSPRTVERTITAVAHPAAVPAMVLDAVAARLVAMAGLMTGAAFAAVTYSDGRRGHVLALRDTLPDAQQGLAKAIGEALTFSGVDAGEIDVVFVTTDDPLDVRIRAAGLDLAIAARAPEEPALPPRRLGPGMDPARPPRLK